MTPAARLSAAIEVIGTLLAERRPAADVLKDWGRSHRFAGSGDRAALASLVYDTLRRRASAAWLMGRPIGEETPRALLLGMLKVARGLDVDAIAALCDGSRFAPAPLSEDEHARLAAGSLDAAPAHVRGDYPEWLDAPLAAVFGEARAEEGAALAERAPLDLRVNSLKGDVDKARELIAHLSPEPGRWSPLTLRIALEADGKAPPLTSEPAYLKGLVEIQDEGSQIAAILAAPPRGGQVLDLCAGGGGKTLELAALMDGAGQLYAYDDDLRRLAPIHERVQRAGAHNVQVRSPRGKADVLEDLTERMDLVLVDAPCTGTGTWRRNPDAKWRMRPGALAERVKEQASILDTAARYVKPGGRLAYVTCSLLDEENVDQVRAFLDRHSPFHLVPAAETVLALGERGMTLRAAALERPEGLLLTPRRTATDGFFVSVMVRRD
ncbi:RsmB/NOP family class I SAM-dependent RNA methyltransferase [Ancylobacter dichloromethanicus]|uniref:MFS transporter n=1 Tax=Ancylobacter dichloromethanicus TaxID=518825 RepID=A0A9W6JCG2_9HYPH|nr:RsmB/NOP family class I SAM-dependent RNA methyltransferase [Ancylobacter dichloromethanicus]MBS7556539.1 RsmB/NOP family class I SAM-dependent RNA methyltransferase [Ancylobacter dichloromethanicus]GLK74452.1 MFS transporter [Ancylobacter dichloromethanicus]